MGREELLFDSRAAIEELAAAGIPRRQADAYVGLLVQVIERKLDSDRRRLEGFSYAAGSDIGFDTRLAADELVAAGVPQRQADALARLLARVTKFRLAVTGVI